MPIHQLMVKTGVNIFFQGHDHLFAKEVLDGVVYQEVPMPSDSTYIIGTRDNGDAFTDVKVDASGHLRVTVAPTGVKVDYVRAWLPRDETATQKNRDVAYSYTVSSKATAVLSETLPHEAISLEQNFPNPFNPSTAISFQLSDVSHTTLRVYDVLGRVVGTLVDRRMEAGSHTVRWNASDVPAGVYFYQMRVNGSVVTRKAVVLK
jgi:hypothetical protein